MNKQLALKFTQLPPVLLAALLQLAPMCRSVFLNPSGIQTGFAVVFRWIAGAGIAMGTLDAVSGASATITGLKPYQGTTVIGPTSLTPTIPGGANNITMRIIVANPGSDVAQDYWNCTPLPPGLTINTNIGGNGYITTIPGQVTVAGVYNVKLLAGNLNFGYITTNATITVSGGTSGSPPTITTNPQNVTANVGSSATFTVVANDNGTTPLSYQWRKHGTTNVGGNSATLTINPVSAADADFYDVVVSNSAGNVTSASATLTVVSPPTIQTQPTSQTVNQGGSVTFSVTAGGTGPFTYQWLKHGTTPVGSNSSSYTINPVAATDADFYVVTVSNAAGSVTSNQAVLTVNLPPTIQTQPASQTVNQGGSVTFSVTAGGTGPFTYQWLKHGTTPVGSNSSSLTINPVAAGDADFYVVTVSNGAGSITSDQAVLTVVGPPTILTSPVSQSAYVGGSVTFTVVANGSGTLSYQWRKGTNPVGTDSNTLTLSSVSAADEGSYDVVVSNGAGSVTSTPAATLTVVQPPAVGITLDSQQPADGPKTISWSAIAGKSYTLRRRDNFAQDVWHDIGTTNVTTTGVVEMTDDTSAGVKIRFYQISSQ